jgi:hypothetical protein
LLARAKKECSKRYLFRRYAESALGGDTISEELATWRQSLGVDAISEELIIRRSPRRKFD